MKVLVTGATGFIGLNIIEALRSDNHEIHAYVRESSNAKYLESFNVCVHRGELDDQHMLKTALKGIDYVIHTAGNTSCFNRDYKTLYKVNVVGTKSIVKAAIDCGVKRLVYTSTTSTIGTGISINEKATEECQLRGYRARSPYAKTKLMAEGIVLSAQQSGLEVIILNPAEVIGAYDHNFQWGRMIMAAFANRVPFIPPGGASFCSAREVGKAHVSALSLGRSGERYILAGEDQAYSNFLKIIEQQLETKISVPSINYTRLYWKEKLKDIFYPLLGKEFMVEPYRLRVFGEHYYFSSQKAVNDLGYQPNSLTSMIADCIDWYRSQAILPH